MVKFAGSKILLILCRRAGILIQNAVIVFVFGLVLGSFFNVCIYRIQRGKSIVFPSNSYCPKCKTPIKWYDNMPVLSFLLLKGRCRACSSKISLRYPIVELLTGILFVLFFLKFGLEKIYFFYIILVGYMIVLTFIDIDKKEVPDGVIVSLFMTGFILNTLEMNRGINIFSGLIGALAGGFAIYLMNYFTSGKIGEGDVKLFAALGFCLGLQGVTALILWSFIAGGAISAVLVIAKKFKRTDKIAFVPFVALAFVLSGLIL